MSSEDSDATDTSFTSEASDNISLSSQLSGVISNFMGQGGSNQMDEEPDSDDLLETDSDDLSGPDWDDLSGPDSDDLSGPDSDDLSGPDSDDLSGPDSDDLSGPDSDDLSGPDSDDLLETDLEDLRETDWDDLPASDWGDLPEPSSLLCLEDDELEAEESEGDPDGESGHLDRDTEDPEEDPTQEQSGIVELSDPEEEEEENAVLPPSGRRPHVNAPLLDIEDPSPRAPRARRAWPRRTSRARRARRASQQRRAGDVHGLFLSYKSPFQFGMSCRIPCTSRRDSWRMFIRLLCGSFFSQAAGLRDSPWQRQKYRAFVQFEQLPRLGRGAAVFPRPPEEQENRSFHGRVGSSSGAQPKFRMLVCPPLSGTRGPRENPSHQRGRAEFPKSHRHKVLRPTVTITDGGWKYVCPVCRGLFDTLEELRLHTCGFPGN